jgi:hypothetical protein
MHGELTLEELMHVILHCNLSEHLQHVRLQRMKNYGCLLVHQKPGRQVIDLIFMGSPMLACSHTQKGTTCIDSHGLGGEHAAALYHGLLRKNKGRVQTKC